MRDFDGDYRPDGVFEHRVAAALVHPPEWHARRAKCLTGSDAAAIMEGGEAAYRLWCIKTGKEQSDDFADILPVQLGTWTEPFNVYWFERTTGRKIRDRGTWRINESLPWQACTLDGICDGALFEAKHSSGRQSMSDLLSRYAPQLTHNASVIGASKAILSVLFGNERHEWAELEIDPFYTEALIEREREFWTNVQERHPPSDWTPVLPPPPPEKWRTLDMTSNNAWAAAANDWLENKAPAKAFESAAKTLKSKLEPDVGKAFGHGVVITRSKSGALIIKEEK